MILSVSLTLLAGLPGCGEVDAVDAEVRRLLREEYVIAAAGERAAGALPDMAGRDFASREAFAEWLDGELERLTGDGHFNVEAIDAAAPERDWIGEWREEGLRNNGGVTRAEVLPGNVGYLRIATFHDLDLSGQPLLAAFDFLARTDALIVDVRGNGGGSGASVATLRRHLHGSDGYTRFAFIDRDGVDHAESWYGEIEPLDLRTYYAPERPVYVLIDGGSFSGSEELAYGIQADGRGRIVGEPSGGGANPPESFDLACDIRIWLPTWQPVHPVTGANWEGTGVRPDIPGGEDALATAHRAALDALGREMPQRR